MWYALYDCVECVNDHVLSFGCEHVTVLGEVVARSVNLAQARGTRPSETCRCKPGVSRTLAQAEDSGFERGQSRSDESHSPRRGGMKAWNVAVV